MASQVRSDNATRRSSRVAAVRERLTEQQPPWEKFSELLLERRPRTRGLYGSLYQACSRRPAQHGSSDALILLARHRVWPAAFRGRSEDSVRTVFLASTVPSWAGLRTHSVASSSSSWKSRSRESRRAGSRTTERARSNDAGADGRARVAGVRPPFHVRRVHLGRTPASCWNGRSTS